MQKKPLDPDLFHRCRQKHSDGWNGYFFRTFLVGPDGWDEIGEDEHDYLALFVEDEFGNVERVENP